MVKLLYNLEKVALNVGQNYFKDFCLKKKDIFCALIFVVTFNKLLSEVLGDWFLIISISASLYKSTDSN